MREKNIQNKKKESRCRDVRGESIENENVLDGYIGKQIERKMVGRRGR